MISGMLRRLTALGLALTCPLAVSWAQQPYAAIEPTKASVPALWRSYFPVEVPPVRLANSGRFSDLVRGGILYLTAQDAIALALENNIDIEVARYNPLITSWNLTRAEAGGALPGVPSNTSQVGAAALGQGVAGSQAAAGIVLPGSSSKASQTSNTSIQQIGPVTQTLDPIIQETSTFSHTTNLLPVETLSGTATLIDLTRAYSLSFTQGLLTGGSATVSYAENYLNENSPTDSLNPSSAPSLNFTFQQGFLQGFGIALNSRFITVAKMNVGISDITFQSQVINVVAQVLNDYYSLEAADEDSKAKRTAADTARTFLANVKEQVRLGALAPSDEINAESQLVTSQQALVDSDATRQQQEVILKNLLSRPGTADPVLANDHPGTRRSASHGGPGEASHGEPHGPDHRSREREGGRGLQSRHAQRSSAERGNICRRHVGRSGRAGPYHRYARGPHPSQCPAGGWDRQRLTAGVQLLLPDRIHHPILCRQFT